MTVSMSQRTDRRQRTQARGRLSCMLERFTVCKLMPTPHVGRHWCFALSPISTPVIPGTNSQSACPFVSVNRVCGEARYHPRGTNVAILAELSVNYLNTVQLRRVDRLSFCLELNWSVLYNNITWPKREQGRAIFSPAAKMDKSPKRERFGRRKEEVLRTTRSPKGRLNFAPCSLKAKKSRAYSLLYAIDRN